MADFGGVYCAGWKGDRPGDSVLLCETATRFDDC